jgi:hypothetical protein
MYMACCSLCRRLFMRAPFLVCSTALWMSYVGGLATDCSNDEGHVCSCRVVQTDLSGLRSQLQRLEGRQTRAGAAAASELETALASVSSSADCYSTLRMASQIHLGFQDLWSHEHMQCISANQYAVICSAGTISANQYAVICSAGTISANQYAVKCSAGMCCKLICNEA